MDVKLDRDAIQELAAQKVADEIVGGFGGDIAKAVESRLDAEVSAFLSDDVRGALSAQIDARMAEEVEAVLSAAIVPVDMWGEKTGDPTTIRDQLHARAMKYWDEKVEPDRNNRGKFRVTTSYGGEPRHKAVFKQVAAEAFEAAIKENITEIVKAFKDALKKDAQSFVLSKIEEHIKIPTRR